MQPEYKKSLIAEIIAQICISKCCLLKVHFVIDSLYSRCNCSWMFLLSGVKEKFDSINYHTILNPNDCLLKVHFVILILYVIAFVCFCSPALYFPTAAVGFYLLTNTRFCLSVYLFLVSSFSFCSISTNC